MDRKITVEIGEGLLARIDRDVASGSYASRSELIEHALVDFFLPVNVSWPPSDEELRQAVAKSDADPREYSAEEVRDFIDQLRDKHLAAAARKKVAG